MIVFREEKTHRGYLSVLKTPTDSSSWEKYWFVLRRPLLIIYKDKQESQELAVIGLDDVKTQWNLIELEENLQVSLHIFQDLTHECVALEFVFCLYKV